MKTERRHELATNVLADWLGETIESVKPYSTAISATVLGVIVALFGWIYWSNKSEQKLEQGWDSYFSALELGADDKLQDVADQYGDSTAGLWARLSLADARLDKGLQQLFEDRAVAKDALNDAEEGFEFVAEHAPRDSMLVQRALLGLAETYESQNHLDEARDKYRELVERFPDGAYTEQARQRLTDLEKPTTKRFYDWFAQQTPKPKPILGAGTPGEKPAFDSDTLLRQPLGSEHPFRPSPSKNSDEEPAGEKSRGAGGTKIPADETTEPEKSGAADAGANDAEAESGDADAKSGADEADAPPEDGSKASDAAGEKSSAEPQQP